MTIYSQPHDQCLTCHDRRNDTRSPGTLSQWGLVYSHQHSEFVGIVPASSSAGTLQGVPFCDLGVCSRTTDRGERGRTERMPGAIGQFKFARRVDEVHVELERAVIGRRRLLQSLATVWPRATSRWLQAARWCPPHHGTQRVNRHTMCDTIPAEVRDSARRVRPHRHRPQRRDRS
eukprot:COSAG06_NODE_10628_length_1646_cov_1.112476_1_plen_175_part_00